MPFWEHNWIRELKTSEINFGFGLTMWIKLRLLLNSAHYNCWLHCTQEDTLPTAQRIALNPMYAMNMFYCTFHTPHTLHTLQALHTSHTTQQDTSRTLLWATVTLDSTPTAHSCTQLLHTSHCTPDAVHINCTVCAAQKTLHSLGGALVWLSVTLNIAPNAQNPHRNIFYTYFTQCEHSAQCEHTWHKTLEEEQWLDQYISHLMHTVTYLTLHTALYAHSVHSVSTLCSMCSHLTQNRGGGDGRSSGAVACHSLPLVPARNRSGHPILMIFFVVDNDKSFVFKFHIG